MAEAIGVAASIITVVEVGTKVAAKLWQLGRAFQRAGKQAREISKKTKLVTQALKQLEPVLRQHESSTNLSLVEDHVMLCEERLDEAQRLVDILEKQIKSRDPWNRSLFKIRFLLEKSKFSLLHDDMESLQVTLNLYVTTLTYQQGEETAKLLTEIRDQLIDRKLDVENDLQHRTIGNTITAAVLSLQYDNHFFSSSAQPSEFSPSQQLLDLKTPDREVSLRIEELDEQDEDYVEKAIRSLSRQDRPGNPISRTTGQYVPFDLMEEETMSKAIVLFTQIQVVQKKTLRRAAYELDRASEVGCDATSDLHGSNSETDIEVIQHTPSPDPVNVMASERQKGDISSSQRAASSLPQAARTAFVEEVDSSDEHDSTSTNEHSSRLNETASNNSMQKSDTEPQPSPVTKGSELGIRKQLASQYMGRPFGILNRMRGEIVWEDFWRLEPLSLHNMILDAAVFEQLDYRAPLPARFMGPRARTLRHKAPYQSPYQISQTFMGWHLPTNLKKATEVKATYVIAYAQWFTDREHYKALCRKDYRITLSTMEGKIFSVDSCLSQLTPGCVAEIRFQSRELARENMLLIHNEYSDRSHLLINGGAYRADLAYLCDTDAAIKLLASDTVKQG